MAERYIGSGRDTEPAPAAPAIAFLAVLAGGAIATLIGIATHAVVPGAIGGLLVLVGAWLRRGSRELGFYVLLVGVGFAVGAAAAIALPPASHQPSPSEPRIPTKSAATHRERLRRQPVPPASPAPGSYAPSHGS